MSVVVDVADRDPLAVSRIVEAGGGSRLGEASVHLLPVVAVGSRVLGTAGSGSAGVQQVEAAVAVGVEEGDAAPHDLGKEPGAVRDRGRCGGEPGFRGCFCKQGWAGFRGFLHFGGATEDSEQRACSQLCEPV